MENISKIYNGRTILDNVSLTIEDNDRIGLVGINGCGKSTLLRIITGKEEYESQPEPNVPHLAITRASTVGFLEQNSGLDRSSKVMDEMMSVFSELLAVQDKVFSSLTFKINKCYSSGKDTHSIHMRSNILTHFLGNPYRFLLEVLHPSS